MPGIKEVANDEPGGEDASLQCALAEPEPEPQLEPEPRSMRDQDSKQDRTAQPAKRKGQNEEKGEAATVAAGFVEVVHDSY